MIKRKKFYTGIKTLYIRERKQVGKSGDIDFYIK